MTNPERTREPLIGQSPNAPACACAERAPAGAEGVPIACDLTVFSGAERAEHRARTQTLFAAIEGVTEEADGFVLAFASTLSRRTEIGHWMEAERRCCPFYRFEVREQDAGKRVVLRISGPPSAKAILLAAMEEYGACRHAPLCIPR
jgi:hypothetical protein